MNANHRISRRNFVKFTLLGGAGALLGGGLLSPGLFKLGRLSPISTQTLISPEPIHKISNPGNQTIFAGDDPHKAHEVLWHKPEFLKKVAFPSQVPEKAKVVVIGGGIAGLLATDALAEYSPVLLERADRFGGNSRGEQVGDLSYSVGAAYITRPEPGGPFDEFFTRLGLSKQFRKVSNLSEESILKNDTKVPGYWGRGNFKRLREKLFAINKTAFPDIPVHHESAVNWETLKKLDQQSFRTWLEDEMEALDPDLLEFLQLYFWSSFCAGMEEVSAAYGLSFLASDMVEGIAVLPGGNAAIAQAVYKRILNTCGKSGLRENALVYNVQKDGKGVLVHYLIDEKPHAIHADTVIMAAPKFVARHMITGMPRAQIQAIQRLKYRAYVVATVLLKGKHPAPDYDLFLLEGQMGEPHQRICCDVIYSHWAYDQKPSLSGLTLYRPYPFEGARTGLYANGAYNRVRKDFESYLPSLFFRLGLKESDVLDMRLTRWGHPFPIPMPGLLSEGVYAAAHQPLWDRLFFANQDNWCLPCFESSAEMAWTAAAQVRQVLG